MMKPNKTENAEKFKEKKVGPVPREGIGELEPLLIRNLPEVCRQLLRENDDLRKVLEGNVKIEAEKEKLVEKMGKITSRRKGEEGREVPLLDRKEIHPPARPLKAYFERMLEILKRYRPELESDIQAIESALQDSRIKISELVENAFQGRGNVFPSDLNAQLLEEAVELSGRPFLEARSRAESQRLPDREYFEGFCPVCGGEPYLAIFREEGGRKYLRCGLCDWEWHFPRLRCQFCGNREQKRLKYIEVPGESGRGWRVDICLKCKRYLKAVDTREVGEIINPRILDLATLPYDILAEKKGYERRPIKLGSKTREK